ncbi:A/G-specific adenine glycosylase [Mesobacillus boroniphilus]|uniref:A/G-specific adenine glycosylase n=1 Tax=Mesobacillus boroniphilus TaxID=308892 RepID=A0A944CK03_9BACI|nr:hypothetical protein [Mesobacillus boroniphilus]MBS8263852.1 A/G-specific adenine glycosylase [Mesobacillus boroniphilus]
MNINFDEERVNDFRLLILKWGHQNYAAYPWRHTKNKWHALVAEIMLQRTNADQVVPVYESFVEMYPSPEDLLMEIETNIFKSLGLHWREEILHSLAREIYKLGYIPEDKKSLLKLPGVGDYISAAFRSFHLNIRDVIIDSNVVRLYGRFFGFETVPETRRKKWFKELAEEITPNTNHKEYNYAILDFTRNICKPSPLHKECVLSDLCCYAMKNIDSRY